MAQVLARFDEECKKPNARCHFVTPRDPTHAFEAAALRLG
jgi:hypothetical protein